ncbi:hypothetical protein CHU98_g2651 [Xylaria longipes]|nr:hypothetical protein CHU98_g2651 [Xylaria longipes]
MYVTLGPGEDHDAIDKKSIELFVTVTSTQNLNARGKTKFDPFRPLPLKKTKKDNDTHEVCAAVMIEHMNKGGYKMASGLVRARHDHHRYDYGFPPEDVARRAWRYLCNFEDANQLDHLHFARKSEPGQKRQRQSRGVPNFDIEPVGTGQWIELRTENSLVSAGFPIRDSETPVHIHARYQGRQLRVTFTDSNEAMGIVLEDVIGH